MGRNGCADMGDGWEQHRMHRGRTRKVWQGMSVGTNLASYLLVKYVVSQKN